MHTHVVVWPLLLPSSRFRDLVDLMIIVTRRGGTELAADAVTAAVVAEQARRGIAIPLDLPAPAAQWSTGYRKLAVRVVPRSVNRLDSALTRLRAFAGPVLEGTATGTWQADARRSV